MFKSPVGKRLFLVGFTTRCRNNVFMSPSTVEAIEIINFLINENRF